MWKMDLSVGTKMPALSYKGKLSKKQTREVLCQVYCSSLVGSVDLPKRLERKMIVLDWMQQQWRWKPDSLVSLLLLAVQYVVYFSEVVFLGNSLQCQYEYPERLTRCRGGSGWMWKDHAVVRSSWRDREVVGESICQGVFNFFLTFRDPFILVATDFVLKKIR